MNYAATFLSNSDFFINGTTNCNNSVYALKHYCTQMLDMFTVISSFFL